MGKAHNNADGMSRHPCPPYACTCYEFEESLDCGPCKKCEEKMTITINSVTTRSTNTTENDTDSSWIQKYSNSEIRAHQLNDPEIAPIIYWKEESETRPGSRTIISENSSTRHLWLCWDSLEIQNGVLVKTDSDYPRVKKLIAPQSLHKEILALCHNCIISGHSGYKKTRGKIQQNFYWFKQKESVLEWVQKCDICAINRRAHRTAKAPMRDMRV